MISNAAALLAVPLVLAVEMSTTFAPERVPLVATVTVPAEVEGTIVPKAKGVVFVRAIGVRIVAEALAEAVFDVAAFASLPNTSIATVHERAIILFFMIQSFELSDMYRFHKYIWKKLFL